ncbi:hypothetical protein C8R32_10152 [Nitrosospira sp. Nsp5]|jgi:hypothetical protein|uniref:DUF4398 domain-containing protein n=1 Tax=Nitrosospira multiformis TaxID=1231 RepID=A0ABY0TGY8_9PROT|nr:MULTISPECIES: hypothetical protein [Nitrosospira]PTR10525.1 hypothetical protein C8R32_10152 [Nitrosospira sp. Nsp5]SCX88631.1 hypothetical protein SAMN05216308_101728 [Nitrosospira sp. Nsp13]SDQ81740.1 hypothetical protein SAMN05216402_2410 [Nitrosospira multiformis]
MKTRNIFSALSMIGFLASVSSSVIAAEPVDTPEIRAAAQKAVTRSDHEAIAKFYEDAATQIKAKAKEQRELLEQYENKSYLYGRQAQDLQSHASAQVREYERAVEANIKEARLHHQMALKADENHAAANQQKLSAVSR